MISKNIDSTKMVQNIAVSLSDQSVIRPICLQEQIRFELSFKRSQGTGSVELKRQGIPESWRCYAKASITISSIPPGLSSKKSDACEYVLVEADIYGYNAQLFALGARLNEQESVYRPSGLHTSK